MPRREYTHNGPYSTSDHKPSGCHSCTNRQQDILQRGILVLALFQLLLLSLVFTYVISTIDSVNDAVRSFQQRMAEDDAAMSKARKNVEMFEKALKGDKR